MSAAPGDRPRDDSFDDEGSPSTETKDGDAKHVVSLRRQTDAPAPVDDEQPEEEGAPTTSNLPHRQQKDAGARPSTPSRYSTPRSSSRRNQLTKRRRAASCSR